MKKLVLSIVTIVLVNMIFYSPAYKYESKAFTEEETVWIEEARSALYEILETKKVMAVVYLTDSYQVRGEADIDSEIIINVPGGQSVFVQDSVLTEDYEAWLKVSFEREGVNYEGYIQRGNLACSDEVFLEWEMDYGMNPGSGMTMFALEGETKAVYQDIEQFPDSYKNALTELKKLHPNWIFVKMDTGLVWKDVLGEELKDGRSLISASLAGYLQEGKFSSGWSYATEETLAHYLDPRNGLTEKRIFQFEQLTFNQSYHTNCEAAVQGFLSNTFMSGKVPQTDMTYAHVFWAIGKELNISPFHLASRVYQEQGRGTSSLISGTYPGYEGYYNYFNVGASGTSDKEVIENGLKYAKEHGWNSPYLSLYYGSKVIGANYIAKGQDTLYLQKFDVDNSSSGMFWHQYMQNIMAPTSEAGSIYKLYAETGALNNIFVFKIPVYNNMPKTACPLPESSDRIILDVPSGYEDTLIYVDGVAYQAEKRNGYLIAKGAGLDKSTAVMYRYDSSKIPVGMSVWMLENAGNYYKAVRLSELDDLLSYHGFSIRITGKTGIRFKSGIATTVKEQLTGTGVAGYKLVEYGTLVMTKTNYDKYPMIKDGKKVGKGVSYGVNNDGSKVDYVFETINNRHRFTSILIGLPPEEYKTEFAFRGYVTLLKDKKEVTIYGPIMTRSIYTLAKQVLDRNIYEEGSSEYKFLKQLIADGDKAS